MRGKRRVTVKNEYDFVGVEPLWPETDVNRTQWLPEIDKCVR